MTQEQMDELSDLRKQIQTAETKLRELKDRRKEIVAACDHKEPSGETMIVSNDEEWHCWLCYRGAPYF